jgi:predicted PurR-regulated permease PerM
MTISQKIKKIGSIELPRWSAIIAYAVLSLAIIIGFIAIFFPELIDEIVIWYAISTMEVPY